MKETKALLFDVDGTILDTREFIILATEHSLFAHGYPRPDRSAISKLVGIPFDDYYRKLTGATDVSSFQKVHSEFQSKNFHLSVPYPGAFETLTELRRRGYKMATITTRWRRTAMETLRRADLERFFDATLFGEDAKPKPNPESLFKALGVMGEPPSAAVMIGDSDVDIEAGRNAGTKTVRALYGFHNERLEEMKADFLINDIRDLLKIL